MNIKTVLVLLIAIGLANTSKLLAGIETNVAGSLTRTLAGISPPELPVKAAELVRAAKAPDRGRTTVDVVTIAVAMAPAAAPSLCAAIAKAVPDMASLAAATAAALQPDSAATIARATAVSAPAQAGRIVAAVCRAAPQQYRQVTCQVAEVVPGATKEILSALQALWPDWKPAMETASNGAGVSVATVLATLPNRPPTPATSAPAGAPAIAAVPVAGVMVSGRQAAPPAIGAPFIPILAPTNATPPSGPVSRGGRDYASP